MKKHAGLYRLLYRQRRKTGVRKYLDYIVSLKLVDSLEEAIAHINHYNTGHSEAIITSDYNHAQKFLNEIDAAAVYVNGIYPVYGWF